MRLRKLLLIKRNSKWNAWVRDITAKLERKPKSIHYFAMNFKVAPSKGSTDILIVQNDGGTPTVYKDGVIINTKDMGIEETF